MPENRRPYQPENTSLIHTDEPEQVTLTDKNTCNNFGNSMRRWFWYSMPGFLLFNSTGLLHRFLFASNTINNLQFVADFSNTVGWLVGVLFCLSRLPHFRWKHENRENSAYQLQKTQKRVLLWITVVFAINAIERGAYLYYDMIHTVPLFNWPEILLLLRYPLLLLAFTSLYRHFPSFIRRFQLTLDGFLILTALLAFGWYFLLGPIILGNHQSAFEKATVIAYPLADAILCFYLFQLSFRDSEPAFRLVRRLFLLGLLLLVFSDLCDIFQILQMSFVWPLLQALTSCLGYILIAFAIQALSTVTLAQYTPIDSIQDERGPEVPSFSVFLWRILLPTACVPAVLFFMIILRVSGGTGPLALGVNAAGMTLFLLLILRQMLVMYESFISHKNLQTVQKELYVKNAELTQTNFRLATQTQELATAYEQQRRANELKDQFLLNVNHELRTPLTEMHGYLELLHVSQDMLDAEARSKFLSHALNGSYELLRVVDTILDTLRSEDVRGMLQKEVLCVSSVVQEVLASVEPREREAHPCALTIPAGLTVYADRQNLCQILCNLLSNALKYSASQTQIVIGACEVPDSASATCLSSIHIWVQDYGAGIPPEDLLHLFEKFFRLARHQTSSIRGTGLGLYICKQLVEAMDGRIWAESSGVPGEGSRFCFTLPNCPSAE